MLGFLAADLHREFGGFFMRWSFGESALFGPLGHKLELGVFFPELLGLLEAEFDQ